MALGIDKLLQLKSKNTLVNVMYHGVTTQNSCFFSPRHVVVNDFEKEIRYFRKNFEIISIDEAFQRIRNCQGFTKKTITISFDDGFANNLNVALPILEKYDIPVTFFVSGICVENDGNCVLWPEIIAALKYFFKNPSLYSDKDFADLTNKIKAMPYQERDTFLYDLDKKHQILDKIHTLPEEIWQLLDKNQLIKMSKSKIVTIGSHGYNHYNLGQIEKDSAKFELEHSKKLLESAIQKEVKHIAYPDGNYDETVKNIAESAGYEGQMAVKYRLPNDKTDNRILDRFGISATTTYESNILFLSKSF